MTSFEFHTTCYYPDNNKYCSLSIYIRVCLESSFSLEPKVKDIFMEFFQNDGQYDFILHFASKIFPDSQYCVCVWGGHLEVWCKNKKEKNGGPTMCWRHEQTPPTEHSYVGASWVYSWKERSLLLNILLKWFEENQLWQFRPKCQVLWNL